MGAWRRCYVHRSKRYDPAAATMSALLVLSMVVAPSSGANIIWDGRNADAAELAKWDWARQQGK